MKKIRIFIAGPEEDHEGNEYKKLICAEVKKAADSLCKHIEVINSEDCAKSQERIDKVIKNSDLLVVLSDKDGKYGPKTFEEASFFKQEKTNPHMVFLQRVAGDGSTNAEKAVQDSVDKKFGHYVVKLPRMNNSEAKLIIRDTTQTEINTIKFDRKSNIKFISGVALFLLVLLIIVILRGPYDSYFYPNMKAKYLYCTDFIYIDKTTLTNYPGLKDTSKWDSIFSDWQIKMKNDPLLDTILSDIAYRERSFTIPKAWIDERRSIIGEKIIEKKSKSGGTEYIVTNKCENLFLSEPSGIEFINLSDSI